MWMLLIEHGADATAQNNDGTTPLHRMSEWGDVDVDRLLIEHGADATAQSNDGMTPLHRASEWGDVLIERGTDVTAHQGLTIDGKRRSGEGTTEESDRGPQDVSSPPFPSCRYQLNVFVSLSELMLDLLTISLAPGVPASLKNIPEKYNIIIHLWTNCFYRLLENLRRSSPTSKIALEYLQEFIYYAYTFYTSLLERNTFKEYHAGWLEALGDLA